MKKNLFLLPLLMGAVLVSGCDDGGKKIVLDFTTGEIDIESRVEDLSTNNQFEVNGVTYNSVGCFDTVDSYNGGGGIFKFAYKSIGGDGKIAQGESLPYLGNADEFTSNIKSIKIDVSVATGGATFYVLFSNSELGPFEAGSISGKKKQVTASTASSFTVENTGSGTYFAIAVGGEVDTYRKNGAVSKITINF